MSSTFAVISAGAPVLVFPSYLIARYKMMILENKIIRSILLPIMAAILLAPNITRAHEVSLCVSNTNYCDLIDLKYNFVRGVLYGFWDSTCSGAFSDPVFGFLSGDLVTLNLDRGYNNELMTLNTSSKEYSLWFWEGVDSPEIFANSIYSYSIGSCSNRLSVDEVLSPPPLPHIR